MSGPGRPALRLLVTRPQPQADDWVQKLAERRVTASALPLLAIAPATDAGALQAAWAALPGMALVMFVSPNAVAQFFALCPTGGPWPEGVIAAGTGPGTYQALLRAGVPAACIRSPGALDPGYGGPFDSEALWPLLADQGWAGRQALVVRGEGGRDWLADTLRQQGASVHFVEAYRRTAAVPAGPALAALQQALAEPHRHLWLLSSSEAVSHLPALVAGQPWPQHQALATHARIAAAARALGFGQVGLVAPLPDAVAQAALAWPRGALPGLAAGTASIQSAPL